MRVAVADDLEVEVVGAPAAGEHRVQLLPGLLPGCTGRASCRPMTPCAEWMVVA